MPMRPGPIASVLRWVSWLFIAAGAAMLGWYGYVTADALIAQRLARDTLETAEAVAPPAPAFSAAEVDEEGWTGRHTAAAPARGTPVAELSIPRLDLTAIVLHGSDTKTLRRGPGHLENTVLPGETGNSVIAGHRDTFFRPLRNIAIGDDIFADTVTGRFHYRVTSTKVVSPHDLSVIQPTDDAALTLITCYPFWVFGDAPDRFVVRAEGVPDLQSEAFEPAPVRPYEAVPVPPPPRPAAAPDDETAVRQTVERFRAIYNARLASHADAFGQPLTFSACQVSVEGDSASAICDGLDGGAEPAGRSFTLVRTAEGWAIRAVVAR